MVECGAAVTPTGRVRRSRDAHWSSAAQPQRLLVECGAAVTPTGRVRRSRNACWSSVAQPRIETPFQAPDRNLIP
jgi:hypothetical protein